MAAPACAWSQTAPLPGTATAQPAGAKAPAFDVVSVKLSRSGSMGGRVMFTPDGLRVSNAPLIALLRMAYGMFNSTDEMMLGIPDWVKSQRFDIEAKMSEADTARLNTTDPTHPTQYAQEQRKLMIQALLADRFKMTAHQEMRMLPVYEMVVAKSGPKLKQAAPGDTYANGIKGPDGTARAGLMTIDRGKLTGQGIGMEQLANWMWQEVDRTVLDKTGLTGKYDVTLQWMPENHSASASANQSESTDASGPSIFTAMQEQLGLKLEPAKAPGNVLVIDHIEKPSDN